MTLPFAGTTGLNPQDLQNHCQTCGYKERENVLLRQRTCPYSERERWGGWMAGRTDGRKK